MVLTFAEAFDGRCMSRDDGKKVIPPSIALVAALETGNKFKLSQLDEAARNTELPGFFTKNEFVNFCEKNASYSFDPNEMARAVSLLAPDGRFTRASLQELAAKVDSSQDSLSNEEIDALFDVLDEDCTGYISAEKLMRALFAAKGDEAVTKQREEYNEFMEAEKERMRREAEFAAANVTAAPPVVDVPADNREHVQAVPIAVPARKKKAFCQC